MQKISATTISRQLNTMLSLLRRYHKTKLQPKIPFARKEFLLKIGFDDEGVLIHVYIHSMRECFFVYCYQFLSTFQDFGRWVLLIDAKLHNFIREFHIGSVHTLILLCFQQNVVHGISRCCIWIQIIESHFSCFFYFRCTSHSNCPIETF